MSDKKDTNGGQTAGQNSGFTPQDEMIYRLKSGIDNNGRYKFALNDMAMGFAAGKGLPQADARKQIEDQFTKRVGQSPYDYLQTRYDQMKEQNQGRDPGRGRGR